MTDPMDRRSVEREAELDEVLERCFGAPLTRVDEADRARLIRDRVVEHYVRPDEEGHEAFPVTTDYLDHETAHMVREVDSALRELIAEAVWGLFRLEQGDLTYSEGTSAQRIDRAAAELTARSARLRALVEGAVAFKYGADNLADDDKGSSDADKA